MTVSATFREAWIYPAARITLRPRRTVPPQPVSNLYAPDRLAAEMEGAMLTLARAAAQRGRRTVLSVPCPSEGAQPTELDHILADPIGMALMQAEANLLRFMAAIAGEPAATAANRRVNGRIHREYEAPAIQAAGPMQ